jgi:hypothetical protein
VERASLIETWLTALERRHLSDLTFPELRRALQALSSLYVERRRGGAGPAAALDTAGKRAAFGLYYGPLHFLLVGEVMRRLGAGEIAPDTILDLGCGTGIAGAAWSLQATGRSKLRGFDTSAWAVREARWTWRTLSLRGTARRCDLDRAPLSGSGTAIVAAFVVNEIGPDRRDRLCGQLLRRGRSGCRILIVEAISKRIVPWWDEWSERFVQEGGRADTWRFRIPLPEILQRLDRAAGLDHSELTGRSLWLPGDEESGSS